MKVKVLQENLVAALSIVMRAVPNNSTLPVLGNVLLATDGQTLRLVSTNLEIGLSTWVPAVIEGEGSVTLPAKTLSELIGTYPNEDVHLALVPDTAKARIKCGKSQTTVNGIPASEFPPMPVSEAARIFIDAGELKSACAQTVIAVSEDEARPVLNGVHITLRGKQLILGAADGFRLSQRVITLAEEAASANVIVPAKTIEVLGKLITGTSDAVSISIEAGRVVFRVGDNKVVLISQLIEGKYPDLESVIPTTYKTRATIPVPVLAKTIKQAKVFARDGSKMVTLSLIPPQPGAETGSIKTTAESTETGHTEAVVEADIEGNAMEITFNVDFLGDALSVIKTPKINIDLVAGTSPGVLRQVGDASYLHVLMPMHKG